MFNWLIGHENSQGMVVEGYNPDTNKLIVENEDGETEEIDFAGSEFHHETIWFDGWESDLYNKLLTEQQLTFYTLSTESADNWIIELYRTYRS